MQTYGIDLMKALPDEGACDIMGGRPVGHGDYIRSPNFPLNYDNSARCEWYATAAGGGSDVSTWSCI